MLKFRFRSVNKKFSTLKILPILRSCTVKKLFIHRSKPEFRCLKGDGLTFRMLKFQFRSEKKKFSTLKILPILMSCAVIRSFFNVENFLLTDRNRNFDTRKVMSSPFECWNSGFDLWIESFQHWKFYLFWGLLCGNA